MPPTRSRGPARVALALALLGLGPACTPARRQVTPTTLGSDLRRLPRGRMAPQPLPGNDLVRRTGPPTVDLDTALAHGPGRDEADDRADRGPTGHGR